MKKSITRSRRLVTTWKPYLDAQQSGGSIIIISSRTNDVFRPSASDGFVMITAVTIPFRHLCRIWVNTGNDAGIILFWGYCTVLGEGQVVYEPTPYIMMMRGSLVCRRPSANRKKRRNCFGEHVYVQYSHNIMLIAYTFPDESYCFRH